MGQQGRTNLTLFQVFTKERNFLRYSQKVRLPILLPNVKSYIFISSFCNFPKVLKDDFWINSFLLAIQDNDAFMARRGPNFAVRRGNSSS